LDLGNDANRSVSKVQTEGKESGGVGRGPMGQEGAAASDPSPTTTSQEEVERGVVGHRPSVPLESHEVRFTEQERIKWGGKVGQPERGCSA